MRASMTATEPVGGTKHRILEVATRLFAEHGIDAVPLRDIAVEADVNSAAINYHFGSKEQLIREVYRRLFVVLNALRLKALDDCEVAAKGRPLEPEAIVHALVAPMVSFSTSPEHGGIYLIRLTYHAYGLSRNFIHESIAEQVDHIALRFVDALARAIPKISREDLFWRFDFAIGAWQHVLLDTHRGHRLKRLSDGLCDTDDNDRIIDELTASLTASFTAPSLPPASSGAARARARHRTSPRKRAGQSTVRRKS
jgi:AcrR family transcriptional regulator